MNNLAPQAASLGPLSGLIVADFSRVLAGPYCTMILADLGATVIKVESPAGDDTRQWMPPAHENISTYYMSVNRNKQSIVLDLNDENDLHTAYSIIERADVFVENFKPGGLKKFGLDKTQTATRWPQLIHASISGFGSAAGAHLPGYDLLIQGLSGFMHITGSPDGPPQRAGVAIFDVVTGLHAAVGILAALRERDLNGNGQHLEANLLSSALSALVNQTTGNAACGNEPMRLGNDHPSLFPYGPFHASDGEIIICIGNNTQFAKLCTSIDIPATAQDPRYATVKLRNEHRETLRNAIETALQQHTVEEWFHKLSAIGIPCAPIETIGGGIRYAEQLGLHPVVMTGTGDGAIPTIANPVTYSTTPVRYDLAPPALNADREDVLKWLSDTVPIHHPQTV